MLRIHDSPLYYVGVGEIGVNPFIRTLDGIMARRVVRELHEQGYARAWLVGPEFIFNEIKES